MRQRWINERTEEGSARRFVQNTLQPFESSTVPLNTLLDFR